MRRLFREFLEYAERYPDEVLSAIWQAMRPRKEVI